MMKHLKLSMVSVAFVALSALAWVGVAHAQAFTPQVDANKTVNGSVYSAGKQVRIAGTVDGDVYCAGQQVIISGTVKGDVLCTAQTITISGKVEGSVRVAAQLVTLQNTVGRSVSIAADQITIEKKAVVGRDATLASSTLELDGIVKRDAVIASGSAIITGSVDRNVRVTGNQLEIRDKAHIAGALEYTSNNSAEISNTALVNGDVTHHTPSHNKERKVFNVSGFIFTLVMLIFAALLLVLLFPQQVHRVSMVAANSLGKTVLVGVVASVGVPILLIGLGLTIVGLPVAIFGLLAWILVIALSAPIAAYYLGSMVLSRAKNPIVIMLLGSVLLAILYYIPLVGWLFGTVAYFIGTGAIVRQLRKHISRPIYRVE